MSANFRYFRNIFVLLSHYNHPAGQLRALYAGVISAFDHAETVGRRLM
jgi:hypothetical protein